MRTQDILTYAGSWVECKCRYHVTPMSTSAQSRLDPIERGQSGIWTQNGQGAGIALRARGIRICPAAPPAAVAGLCTHSRRFLRVTHHLHDASGAISAPISLWYIHNIISDKTRTASDCLIVLAPLFSFLQGLLLLALFCCAWLGLSLYGSMLWLHVSLQPGGGVCMAGRESRRPRSGRLMGQEGAVWRRSNPVVTEHADGGATVSNQNAFV